MIERRRGIARRVAVTAIVAMLSAPVMSACGPPVSIADDVVRVGGGIARGGDDVIRRGENVISGSRPSLSRLPRGSGRGVEPACEAIDQIDCPVIED